MDKPYKTLTCPQLVKYTIIRFIIYSLMLFLLGFICEKAMNLINESTDYICFFAVGVFLISFAIFAYWGKAVFRSFIMVKINEEGISNRFCRIKWNQIDNFGIVDMDERSPKAFTIKSGLMISVSANEDDPKDFRDYNYKNSIFVPYNEKTIRAIEYFGEKKL